MSPIVRTGNYIKYASRNPLKRFFIKRFLERVARTISVLNPENILDAGCGEGFVLGYLKKQGLTPDLTGVDVSETALSAGLSIFPGLKLMKGSLYELPFADESFDIVLCLEVLEHLAAPEKAIEEIFRVSKKYCLVSVPNEPFFTLANMVSGNHFKTFGFEPEHVNFWGEKKFRNLISNYAEVVKVSRPFPWLMLLAEKIK